MDGYRMSRRLDGKGAFVRLNLDTLEDRLVPATFTVTTTADEIVAGNGLRSLREAIAAANSTPGPDVVVVPAGVYKITRSGAGENANATGDFDITERVLIQGAGSGLTVIDGQHHDRVFDLHGAVSARFVGLTLRRGAVVGDGGAINAANAGIVVESCAITENRAVNGGAIRAGTGNVSVSGSTISRNFAQTAGGGIQLGAGTLTLTASQVKRNVAGGSGGGVSAASATITGSMVNGNSSASFGGGVSATAITVTGSKVNGNSAVNGGGGLNGTTVIVRGSAVVGNSTNGDGGGIRGASTAEVRSSTISGNIASADGGGLVTITATVVRSTVSGNSAGGDGGGCNASNLTATRSTLSGNTARNGNGGGALFQTATLSNTTVSGNTASNGDGGGLAIVLTGDSTILNCTIVDNSAASDGGGVYRSPSATQPVEMRNTIVARNLAGGAGLDINGAFVSLGHNLIGVGTGATGFTHLTGGDLIGTALNPMNPMLGGLALNGGPTKTHALLAGSPAVDRGDNAVSDPLDERGSGFPRLKDGNGDGVAVVDIGAFEL